MNTRAIADAIAARFTAVSATVGTETETVTGTALLPNAIARGPVLLVFPPTGQLEIGVSKLRRDILEYAVRLLRDPLDAPTRTAWLYAWIDALRDEVEKDMDLGLAYVAWAQPVSLAAELDGFEYAKNPMDMVELVVRVRLDEVVATVST